MVLKLERMPCMGHSNPTDRKFYHWHVIVIRQQMKTKNTRVFWASNEMWLFGQGTAGRWKGWERTGRWQDGAGNECIRLVKGAGRERKDSIVYEMGLRAHVKVCLWKYIHRLCQVLSNECAWRDSRAGDVSDRSRSPHCLSYLVWALLLCCVPSYWLTGSVME